MGLIEPILPIFLVIILGYFVKRKGFLDESTLDHLNRFIFNFPLPVLVFLGVAKSNLEAIKLKYLFSIFLPTGLVFLLSLLTGIVLKLKQGRLGTFLQASIHGNVSYVGLAVIFYTLGEEALKKGSLFVGFLILLNNTLAVISLRLTAKDKDRGFMKGVLSILTTPVIIATFVGIIFALEGITLPPVLLRTMTILSNIALPMALIVIGGTMKWDSLSGKIVPLLSACIFKLFLLPFFSLPVIRHFEVPIEYSYPLIILLASPVAISSYIMAREINGDPKFASDTITLSTLISPFVFIFWNFMIERI
jgi:predicted permease